MTSLVGFMAYSKGMHVEYRPSLGSSAPSTFTQCCLLAPPRPRAMRSGTPAERSTSRSRGPFQYAQPIAPAPQLNPLVFLTKFNSFLRLPSHASTTGMLIVLYRVF